MTKYESVCIDCWFLEDGNFYEMRVNEECEGELLNEISGNIKTKNADPFYEVGKMRFELKTCIEVPSSMDDKKHFKFYYQREK